MPSSLMAFDPGSPHGFCGWVSLQGFAEAEIHVAVYFFSNIFLFLCMCNRFERAGVIYPSHHLFLPSLEMESILHLA